MNFEFGFYLISALLLWWWIYKPHREVFKKLGLTFLGVGFTVFLLELGASLFEKSPSLSIFQILGSTAVGIFYFVLLRFRRWNAVKVAPVVASIAFLFSLLGLKVGSFEWRDRFVLLHVMVSTFTFTLLVLSAIFSLLRFSAERKLKRGELTLPLGVPVHLLAKLERSFFFFGFLFLTMELIISLIWLKLKFQTFRWDGRIVSTLLLWFYYWLLFHLDRFGVVWVRRWFAVLNLVGAFALVLALTFTRHGF